MPLQTANVDKVIYFQPTASEYKDERVQHPMESKGFVDISNVKRIEMMIFVKENDMENKDLDNKENTFVKFVHIFADKTATTMKSFALVVHTVHAVSLKFSIHFRQWLILHQ